MTAEHRSAGAETSLVETTVMAQCIGTIHPSTKPQSAQTTVPWQLPTGINVIGRQNERAILASLTDAAEREARAMLAVLSGMDGVGKTALALDHLHPLRDRFPDGQLYADLRAHSARPASPDEIITGWLYGLGVRDLPRTAHERCGLYRMLTARRRLVVLADNAASAEQVYPLLPTGPSVTVVTSRFELRELALLDGHMITLRPLDDAAAWELLTAGLPAERFQGELQEARELAQLCNGLPLALRIITAVAAACPARPLTHWAAAMTDDGGPLSTLTLGMGHSVSHALDAVHDTLSARTRRLYQVLGLLPGSAVPRAVAAAMMRTGDAHRPSVSVDAELEELRTRHVLVELGADRIGMHDLVHEHAALQARLHLSPQERSAAWQRLLIYYLRSVGAAGEALDPARKALPPAADDDTAVGEEFGDATSALAWIDRELPTLMALIARAARTAPTAACRLVDAMRPYWFRREHSAECRSAHQHGLDAARTCGDPALLGRMLTSTGWVERHHRPSRALRLLGEALTHFRAHHELWRAASVYNALGLVLLSLGHTEEAHRYCTTAVVECLTHGVPRAAQLARLNLVAIAMGTKDYDEAIVQARAAHGGLAQVGDHFNAALAEHRWAQAERQKGNTEQARLLLSHAVDSLRSVGARWDLASALTSLGELDEGHRPDHALACYSEARTLLAETHPIPVADLDYRITRLRPHAPDA